MPTPNTPISRRHNQRGSSERSRSTNAQSPVSVTAEKMKYAAPQKRLNAIAKTKNSRDWDACGRLRASDQQAAPTMRFITGPAASVSGPPFVHRK
ncbi:MAG: hypothetical protein ABSF91_15395 [Bacteroidota bacterium]